jgi:hypothetical protein
LSFSRRLARRAGADCGAKNSRGFGSKVITAAGRPACFASPVSFASSARWPRCTPSKLPMVSTAVFGSLWDSTENLHGADSGQKGGL